MLRFSQPGVAVKTGITIHFSDIRGFHGRTIGRCHEPVKYHRGSFSVIYPPRRHTHRFDRVPAYKEANIQNLNLYSSRAVRAGSFVDYFCYYYKNILRLRLEILWIIC
jgi:hypothetical protein